MSTIKIGISGWRYKPWRGVFYPKDLKQDRELEYASRVLPTIEINGSFYNLQRPENYAAWYAATPASFVFSVKAPRYITHILRLRNIDAPMANFFASGIFNLKQKLGPILWQFPPTLKFDAEIFENFLRLLPHDTDAAGALAARHDAHVDGRALLKSDKRRRLRHAVEIRHPSFIDPHFVKILRQYRVALVVADSAGKWPQYEDMTTDFMYLRLHGAEELYASGYTDQALERWRQRIDSWHGGQQVADAHLIDATAKPASKSTARPIFCYFDNDMKVHAPFDAMSLIKRLGLSPASVREN